MARKVCYSRVEQVHFYARPKEIAIMKTRMKELVAGGINLFKGKVRETAEDVTVTPRLKPE